MSLKCLHVCNSIAFLVLAYSLSAILIFSQLFAKFCKAFRRHTDYSLINNQAFSIAFEFFLFDYVSKYSFREQLWKKLCLVHGSRDYIRMRERQADGAYLIRESEIEFAECVSLCVSLLLGALLIRGIIEKNTAVVDFEWKRFILVCFLQVFKMNLNLL